MRFTRRTFLAVGVSALGFTAAGVVFNYLSRTRTTTHDEVSLSVETVAARLNVPWSIAFISGDEALFTERAGAVKYLDVGSGRVEEVGRLNVRAVGEGGLLGVEVVRKRNLEVFLYHTYVDGGRVANKVVRAVYNGGLEDLVDVLTDIPGGNIHNGGRIKLGPDGMLYVTTGEAGVPNLSQDIHSLGGKILRIRTDGTVPEDNPFQNNSVYALGLRNPQGIAWSPKGMMYCTDHGPSGENLRFAHDEVNLVVPAGNYGWPHLIGDEAGNGYRKPLTHSGDETWAPSGCCFYISKQLADWQGSFFFACLRGRHLHRLNFDSEGDAVTLSEKLLVDSYGRIRDVVEGPDGALYVLTSNRDGRGNPAETDDRILRIVSNV